MKKSGKKLTRAFGDILIHVNPGRARDAAFRRLARAEGGESEDARPARLTFLFLPAPSGLCRFVVYYISRPRRSFPCRIVVE
jgi:hypothetical protein